MDFPHFKNLAFVLLLKFLGENVFSENSALLLVNVALSVEQRQINGRPNSKVNSFNLSRAVFHTCLDKSPLTAL